jgi:hypothetical protein
LALPVAFLAHGALRLSANHSGYEYLWRGQLGTAWREPLPLFTWPVLATPDDRWAVRAAIDAVVADAYGLTHQQYAHVLGTFSHRSYPKAPDLCLSRFDELRAIGPETFVHRYDPYWDIPLNERLPEPVIQIPHPSTEPEPSAQGDLAYPGDEGRPVSRLAAERRARYRPSKTGPGSDGPARRRRRR